MNWALNHVSDCLLFDLHDTYTLAGIMEFNEVPDDIWITIFENIDGSAQLLALVCTCHRLQELGSKQLLRDLRWAKMESTAHNIEAWKGTYKDMLNVPRKLTLSVVFDFGSAQEVWVEPTPEMAFHDAI